MAVRRKKTAKTMTKAQRMVREKAIIQDLKNAKMSYRQIAVKHQVSLPTVNAKARKAGIRRRARAGMKAKMVQAVLKAPRTRIRRRIGRTAMPARTAGRIATIYRHPNAFSEQFRNLVMQYYPNMPLARFERLSIMIRRAIV